MKSKNILWASVASLLLLASCERELVPYSDPTCRINFLYGEEGHWLSEGYIEQNLKDGSYCTTSYSFIYAGGVERDTLWFKVRTSGFLSDQPRPIALKQIAVSDTIDNAEPGVHYMAFDDPALAQFYQVPANADTLSIPVVLLRDPSLEQKDVVLHFGFDGNDYFQPGFSTMSSRTIYISARLTEPNNWYKNYFGEWSSLKQELMIQWTGEAWDEAYLAEFYKGDTNYIYYMMEWFSRKLAEENALRESRGEEPYPIEFPSSYLFF